MALTFIGTLPSWITISDNCLVGASGNFFGNNQAVANQMAQSSLDEFAAEQQTAGNLICLTHNAPTAGQVCAPYSFLLATNPPASSFTGSGLPAGLTLGASGLISGIPKSVIAPPFTVTAHFPDGNTADMTFTIPISPSGLPYYVAVQDMIWAVTDDTRFGNADPVIGSMVGGNGSWKFSVHAGLYSGYNTYHIRTRLGRCDSIPTYPISLKMDWTTTGTPHPNSQVYVFFLANSVVQNVSAVGSHTMTLAVPACTGAFPAWLDTPLFDNEIVVTFLNVSGSPQDASLDLTITITPDVPTAEQSCP